MPQDQLQAYQGNLKTLHEAQYAKLKASMEQKGFFAPIFVWAGHNYILDGHQRLHVLTTERWTVEGGVPVVEIEADDEKDAAEKLLLLSSTYGKIDEQGVYEFTSAHDISLAEWDLSDLPDFDLPDYLEGYYDAPHNGDAPPDEIPEVAEESVTWSGDLWVLGEHRVLCGDCTIREEVDRLMDAAQADLFITDPPYGVGFVEKARSLHERGYGFAASSGHALISNDQATEDDDGISKFLEVALNAWWASGQLKAGGAFYVCAPAGRTETTFRNVIDKFWPLRQCLVWVKNSFVLSRQDYHWRHESILYGWNNNGSHFFCEDRSQDTVWEISRDLVSDGGSEDNVHPTMKPVALMVRMCANSSRVGELVVDPFLGSGTTLLAAEQTQRRCNGMELQPAYVDVIVKRWQDHTGQEATLDSDGRTFAEVAQERRGEAVDA